MEINDFWVELAPLFRGKAERIQEIDLSKLSPLGMENCLLYLLEHARESSAKFFIRGTEQQIALPSPDAVVSHAIQGKISIAMWLTLPALPMLSVYVDYPDEMSFGYVRGAWDAMAVLAFFDLLYELCGMSPHAVVHPSPDTFAPSDQITLRNFWQDYVHDPI